MPAVNSTKSLQDRDDVRSEETRFLNVMEEHRTLRAEESIKVERAQKRSHLYTIYSKTLKKVIVLLVLSHPKKGVDMHVKWISR
jgi:hypothetical protein